MPNIQPNADGTCSRECEQYDHLVLECSILGYFVVGPVNVGTCPIAYKILEDVARAGENIKWNNMETTWHDFDRALARVTWIDWSD